MIQLLNKRGSTAFSNLVVAEVNGFAAGAPPADDLTVLALRRPRL